MQEAFFQKKSEKYYGLPPLPPTSSICRLSLVARRTSPVARLEIPLTRSSLVICHSSFVTRRASLEIRACACARNPVMLADLLTLNAKLGASPLRFPLF